MRCFRFLKLFVLTFALGWLISPILGAQSEHAVFNDGDSYQPSLIKGPSDKDNLQDYVVVNGEKCEDPYLPETFKDGKDLGFLFKDHIVVHSGKEKSRCIVLKDLPFSGYYRARVVAMYSKDGGALQQNEQYRLAVVMSADSTLVFDTIIPDQNDFDTTKYDSSLRGQPYKIDDPKSGYDYYQNNYDFVPLQKGDNIIRFYAGQQFLGEGQGEHNSVDFYSIELVAPPHIMPEPEFSAGNSNTIDWLGIDLGAVAQEVLYFDTSGSLAKRNSIQALGTSTAIKYESTTINGLDDGHKYGYYVEAYPESGGVVRSDTTYSIQDATPPGRVTIDSMLSMGNQIVHLFWNGAEDVVSGVKEYQIIRSEDDNMETVYSVIDTVPAENLCQDGGRFLYCYVDVISDTNAMNKEYKYRIDAVDFVGNKSAGFESKLVVGVPTPILTFEPPAVADSFYQGAQVTLKADVSMLALPASHKIKFQVARENEKFFDGQFGKNKYFFESDWLPLTDNMKDISHTFDLTDNGAVSLPFIDGHRYLFRAQLRDLQGNKSLWAFNPDSSFVIPDCFPADDITFLDLKAVTNDSNTQGWMELSWGGAVDRTSGIDSFIIYRSTAMHDFEEIARTKETHYKDDFTDINFNGDVSYRIGSVDRVGNVRPDSMSAYEAAARSQSAPLCRLMRGKDVTAIFNGKFYTTTNYLLAKCRVNGIADPDSMFLSVSINGNERVVNPIKNAADSISYEIGLPDKQYGSYTIKVRALFRDKFSSLWSKPIVVEYVDKLPTGNSGLMDENNRVMASNYPNPFNLSTSIQFDVIEAANVRVEVYNVQGRIIRTLFNGYSNEGMHSVLWDGYNSEGRVVSSGIYYYRVFFEGDGGRKESRFQKMLLIK